MVSSISKKSYIIKKNYPFLENFPFPEFQLELSNSLGSAIDLDEEPESAELDSSLVRFIYNKNGLTLSVFVFENELKWLDLISSKVKNLNGINKIIDEALENNDILVKRNGSLLAESWGRQLNDGKVRLSYSTSGEIIANLVSSSNELASVINKIIRLNNGPEPVGLSTREYQIILTYYQFQLIYAKLLLGIVIASKISM